MKYLCGILVVMVCLIGVMIQPMQAQSEMFYSDEGKEIFLNDMKNFVDVYFGPILNEQEPPESYGSDVLALAERLANFAQDYPDSRFADDAELIPLMTVLLGMVFSGDVPSDRITKLVNDLEQGFAKYPDGMFEKETLELSDFFMDAPFTLPRSEIVSFFKSEL